MNTPAFRKENAVKAWKTVETLIACLTIQARRHLAPRIDELTTFLAAALAVAPDIREDTYKFDPDSSTWREDEASR